MGNAARSTTTKRGLGWDHQQARAALPAPQGEPCPYCRRPMLPGQQLDADHSVPRALGGGGPLRWAHRRCNQRAGGRLGGAIKRVRAQNDWHTRWS